MSEAIQITSQQVDGCTLLRVEAPNFTYPYSSDLKQAVEALISPDNRYFVMDCSKIQLVDSYGLASVVSAFKVIRDHHGGLALCGLNDTFSKLVDLTHLNKVLEIWPAESQAIVYLNGLRQEAKKRAKKTSASQVS